VELSQNKLVHEGRDIKNVVFIYCVGTRQTRGDNKYCARFCCTAAVHTALQIKKKYGNVRSYHLFRDIRTYGKQEIMYEDSCKQGDIYLKFDENEPPIVEARDNSCLVKIKDVLTDGEKIDIQPDIVVLVTGMVPRTDRKINDILKVPIGRDQFYNEIHPKLRPVETVIQGVYIAGTCQGPGNISETVMSSLSASAKAHSLLRTGEIELEPLIAEIDTETCEWCGKCGEVCLYDAITKTDYKGKSVAVVNEATCKGCGACTPVCPVDAIDIIGYTNVEIESMIDALAREVNQ
jgi:heterodisulfide reductase subunit A